MPTGDPAAEDKTNILLVDDRPDKLLALEAVLADLGQNLVKAQLRPGGAEARLLQQDFAVILLDVNMPGMDGFETAASSASAGAPSTRPSSSSPPTTRSTHVSRSYSLGAVDYIRTPVVPEILRRPRSRVFVDLYKKTAQVQRQAEERRDVQENTFQKRLAEVDRKGSETRATASSPSPWTCCAWRASTATSRT